CRASPLRRQPGQLVDVARLRSRFVAAVRTEPEFPWEEPGANANFLALLAAIAREIHQTTFVFASVACLQPNAGFSLFEPSVGIVLDVTAEGQITCRVGHEKSVPVTLQIGLVFGSNVDRPRKDLPLVVDRYAMNFLPALTTEE